MGCCKQAENDGYDYVWIDTCCINRDSSTELHEAITSMFRWYKDAAICYAFLMDVPQGDTEPDEEGSHFSSSRWFKRGWTLQETLAPAFLRFYNAAWESLGTKDELFKLVEEITGIPAVVLLSPEEVLLASVAQRMSWAARRETTRSEDRAYCLLGIFSVSMVMTYGEGGEIAFQRLQDAILKYVKDESILAWGRQPPGLTASDTATEMVSGGILAASPTDFLHCQNIKPFNRSATTMSRSTDHILHLEVTIIRNSDGETFGLLGCHDRTNPDMVVGIPLEPKPTRRTAEEYIRPRGRHFQLFQKSSFGSLSNKSIRIQIDNDVPVSNLARTRFLIDKAAKKVELVEVEPALSWTRGRALIETDSDPVLVFARFQQKQEASADFVLVLHNDTSKFSSGFQGSLMIASHGTTLKEIAQEFAKFDGKVLGCRSANIGTLGLQVNVEANIPDVITVKISELERSWCLPTALDATAELNDLDEKRLEECEEEAAKMRSRLKKRAQLTGVAVTEYDNMSYDFEDSNESPNFPSTSDSRTSEASTTPSNALAPFQREMSPTTIEVRHDFEDSDSYMSEASDALSDFSEPVRRKTVSSSTKVKQSRYPIRSRPVPKSTTREISDLSLGARQSKSKVEKRREPAHKADKPRSERQIELLELGILVSPDESNGFPQQIWTVCRDCETKVLDQWPLYTPKGQYIQRRRSCTNWSCKMYYQYQQFMLPVDKHQKSVRQQNAVMQANSRSDKD